MTISKHTPTPWRLMPHNSKQITDASFSSGDPLYHTQCNGCGKGEAEETAAHIVLCVNAHDDLIAALKAFMNAWDSLDDTPALKRERVRAWGMACNAIVKAEGVSAPNTSEPDTNARLIAAAPDLLAALQRLIATDDAHSTIHAPDGDDVARMIEYAAAFDDAREVVAKATGADK